MSGDGGGDVGGSGGFDTNTTAGKGGSPAGDASSATAPSLGASTVQPQIDTASSSSPFVINSPIQAGSLDYLGAGTTPDAGATATSMNQPPTTGFVTSDASLNTGGSPTLGSSTAPVLSGSGSGPSLSDWTAGVGQGTPVAGGGTTAFTSPVDASTSTSPTVAAGSTAPASAGTSLAAPNSGISAAGVASGAPAASSGTPADATSSWGDMLKKGLTSNPLGTAISAAGLGWNILNGQKQTANQGALTQQAAQAGANNAALTSAGVNQVNSNQANAAPLLAQGESLTQPLSTGQLPPQYTQQIETAINDAKTTAISNAAKNGQPTDPTQNTALAQQLAQIENQRAKMTTDVANTLFGAGSGLISTATGVGNQSASSLLSGGQNAANLSGQLYTTLTGIDQKQSDATAKAIASLAQSLNSGGTPQKQAA